MQYYSRSFDLEMVCIVQVHHAESVFSLCLLTICFVYCTAQCIVPQSLCERARSVNVLKNTRQPQCSPSEQNLGVILYLQMQHLYNV